MLNENKDNYPGNTDDAIRKINAHLDRSFQAGYKKGFNDGFEKGKKNCNCTGITWDFDLWDLFWVWFWIMIVYNSCFKH